MSKIFLAACFIGQVAMGQSSPTPLVPPPDTTRAAARTTAAPVPAEHNAILYVRMVPNIPVSLELGAEWIGIGAFFLLPAFALAIKHSCSSKMDGPKSTISDHPFISFTAAFATPLAIFAFSQSLVSFMAAHQGDLLNPKDTKTMTIP
ncbi:MAG: hypothetical protein V4534_08540 [Myxococcota bacterium]